MSFATPLARLPRTLSEAVAEYRGRPPLDLSLSETDPEHVLTRYLLYYLLPLWTAAGIFDWYWHKQTDIEHTAGMQESLIHLAMFSEVGAPILMGLFLEINAGLLATMAGALVVHEATAFWDVSYATDHRHVKPNEQHTHSFLEVLPFMALTMTSTLHWDQLQSLFGIGKTRPDWKLRLKKKRLPGSYILAVIGLIVAGTALPYSNEILRCWRARNQPHYHGNCTTPQRP